jgi:F-type H+-transporting ATPase subunit alpha
MALSLYAVNEGLIDDVPANKVVDFETALHAYARQNAKPLLDQINQQPDYNDQIAGDMRKLIEAFKKTGTY